VDDRARPLTGPVATASPGLTRDEHLGAAAWREGTRICSDRQAVVPGLIIGGVPGGMSRTPSASSPMGATVPGSRERTRPYGKDGVVVDEGGVFRSGWDSQAVADHLVSASQVAPLAPADLSRNFSTFWVGVFGSAGRDS
jgi:hypothetical protein